MKIAAISIFLTLFAASTFAASPCYIEAWDKIFYVSKKAAEQSTIIKRSNCPRETQDRFTSLVLSFENSVSTQYLKMTNAKRFRDREIIITPGRIEILDFKTVLNKKLSLGSKYVWTDLKILGNRHIIGADRATTITPEVQTDRLGFKNIAVSIQNPITNVSKKVWLTGKLKIKAKALVSNGFYNIDPQGMNPKMFRSTYVLTDRPEQLFVDTKRLQHYRLTHPINKNAPLMVSDVIGNNLVKNGMPSTIIFKSKKLALSGTAIPLRAAKYGETVQLRSPKSKKLITGKVVDYNKVEVQL